jgi:type IV secretion system protein VirB10
MSDEKQIPVEIQDDTQPRRTPELRDRRSRPEGVVPKQSQSYVIAGLAILILLAVMFSNNRARQTPKSSSAVAVSATDANQRKIDELRHDLTEEQRQSEQSQKAFTGGTSATSSGASSGSQNANAQLSSSSTVEPPRDPVKEAERALAFKSRFASNLISPVESKPQLAAEAVRGSSEAAYTPSVFPGALLPEATRGAATPSAMGQGKRPPEVNVNSATGQPYVLFEGTVLDTALVNRLDGEFSGPVKVIVTNPVYSQNRQHVLIPEGTFLLGEVQKVSGFGQRRLAVVFHRLLMPDGYSVDLDQFHGLDQAGETGLKDKINNHYLQIFGTSIALGLIAGAAEATTNAYGYVAAAVCVLLGPIFIPFFIVPKLDWLFWGWFKAFLGFSFYQVVASAFIYVFSKVLLGLLAVIGPITLSNAFTIIPALVVTLFVCIYGLVKIPELTASILGGRAGTWASPLG